MIGKKNSLELIALSCYNLISVSNYDKYNSLTMGNFLPIVKPKYPLNRIDEVIENGTRNKRDTDWYDDKWESYRRRIKSNSRFISSQGNSVSVNGMGNDPMEENQNDKSEENNQEGDISPEKDTYFKTGADGTNRPRYEFDDG